jgi:hypothetical protein
MKYQIRKKMSIGQQLETAYDKDKECFVKEERYGEPSFEATKEKARLLLAELKQSHRNYKWMRLYEVVG